MTALQLNKKYSVVIPSRLASTRLHEKALCLISGKPLIQHVIRGVQKSKLISKIIVATDEQKIAEVARSAGAVAVMTDSSLPSGTDRVLAALKSQEQITTDFVFNVQGDEPLIDGALLDEMITQIEKSHNISMITCAQPLSMNELDNPNIVKVILNQNSEALYFSRFPIPFSRQKFDQSKSYSSVFKHIGIYGYDFDFLEKFCAMKPCELEIHESLEQLRALHLGAQIKVHMTDRQLHGVDTIEDLQIIEKILNERDRNSRENQ